MEDDTLGLDTEPLTTEVTRPMEIWIKSARQSEIPILAII